jgi:hypothetical protein
MEGAADVQSLVEDYLVKKCDPTLQHAVKNLLKMVFFQAKASTRLTELEILLQYGSTRITGDA